MIIPKKTKSLTGSQEISREFEVVLKQNASNYFDLTLAAELRKVSEARNPPSSNTGGTPPLPPPFFPHGEKSAVSVVKNKTKIDWLSFTSTGEVPALEALLLVIWPGVVFTRNIKGLFGYPESSTITLDGVNYGQIAYGASHGRNYVSLDGTACKTLTDELVEVFHEALSIEALEVRLSRLDLCLDFYRGEQTYEHAKRAFAEGRFKRKNAPGNPKFEERAGIKDGRNLGRTMYVGTRGGHVFGRIYEKGLEIFAKLPDDLRLLSEIRELDNAAREAQECQDSATGLFKADDWLRLEVEYRQDGKDLLLPLEMMLRRDEYFAGAYPYFHESLAVSDLAGIRPVGMKSEFQVDLLAMIGNMRRSYGSLVHSLSELGFTSDQVVEQVTNGKHNSKLVKAGLVSKMREAVDMYRADDPDWDIPF